MLVGDGVQKWRQVARTLKFAHFFATAACSVNDQKGEVIVFLDRTSKVIVLVSRYPCRLVKGTQA
jgi:hypothetical protein